MRQILRRLSVALVLALSIDVLLITTTSRARAQSPTGSPIGAKAPSGRWQGILHYDSVAIEFPLSWSRSRSGSSVLALYNGADSITSTAVRYRGDSIIVEFAHLATRLRGARKADGFEGFYLNPRRNDSVRVTATVAPATAPATGVTAGTIAPDIGGTWILPNDSPKGEHAWRFVVHQQAGQLTATILRVDGDAGAYSGRYDNGEYRLYHFDGTRPGRLLVRPDTNGTLRIEQRGPRGKPTTFVAYRPEVARAKGIPEPANFATHTRVRDPREPFAFDFPDVNGQRVTNRDARFAGKVVIVNVTGSWCPNCHDEAPYLSALYTKYRERGLEIVALDFEEPEELADLSRLKAFIARYRIAFPYLVAGTPREVLEKLPQAVNLNTWPATFFLGRDGTVRAVRTGFAAKASGIYHDSLTTEYEAIVQGLLTEPAARTGVTVSDTLVRRVHRQATTIDAHIDIRPTFNTSASDPFIETIDQFDLPKIERGELDVAVVSLFAESLRRTPENRERARRQFDTKLAALQRFVAARPERLGFATSPDELARLQATGKRALVLGTLNTLALRPDTSELIRLHREGVRVFGFAHVGDNDFAHSSRPSAAFGDTVPLRSGLTDLGKESVAVLNRLGVVLDVSQLTPAGVFDVLRLSTAPVIASHSALRRRVDHPRNLSDAEAKAIAERGGVIHVVAFGPYLRENPQYTRDYEARVWAPFGLVSGRDDPTVKLDSAGQRRYGEAYRAFSQTSWRYWTLADYLDTIDEAVKLVGIDHVGLSSDFNHGGGVDGYVNVGEAENVTRGLLARGYTERDIGKLWGGNFLRVWRAVEQRSRQAAGAWR